MNNGDGQRVVDQARLAQGIDQYSELLISTYPFCPTVDAHEDFFGRAPALVAQCRAKGARAVLLFETLVHQSEWSAFSALMESPLFFEFDAIRVADWGVATFLADRYLQYHQSGRLHPRLQWLGQRGPLNQAGLAALIARWSPALERIVLSNQLDRAFYERNQAWLQQQSTQFEVLASGRLPLLTTMRALSALGVGALDSLESPHSNFPFVTTELGSTLFSPQIFQLSSASLEFLRAHGVRYFTEEGRFILADEGPVEPNEGLFTQNQTDELFSKIRPGTLAQESGAAFGQIISVERDDVMVVKIFAREQAIGPVPTELCFVLPGGRCYEQRVGAWTTLQGGPVTMLGASEGATFYLIPWSRAITPGTLLTFPSVK